MFWGLVLQPNRRYRKIVEESFRISQANLDVATAGTGHIQVIINYEGSDLILATLNKTTHVACSLDLTFSRGEKICFRIVGDGNVHLTGYYLTEEISGYNTSSSVGDISSDPSAHSTINLSNTLNDTTLNKSKKKDKGLKKIEQVLYEDSDEDEDEDETELNSDFDDSDEDVDLGEEEEEEEEEYDEEEDEDEFSSDLSEEEEDEKPTSNKIVDSSMKKKKIKEGLNSSNEIDTSVNKSEKKKKNKSKLEESKNLTTPTSDTKKKKNKMNDTNETGGKRKNEVDVEDGTPGKVKKSKTESKNNTSLINSQDGAGGGVNQKRVLKGGVVIEDLKIGQGFPLRNGNVAKVYYEGRLQKNNQKFDECRRGTGFELRVGRGEVISGWDVGLLGMKQGGKRRITIPPSMGYGDSGYPPAIPPKSTLVFEVELRHSK